MAHDGAGRSVKSIDIQSRGAQIVPDIFEHTGRGTGHQLDAELHLHLLVGQVDDQRQFHRIAADVVGDPRFLADQLRRAVGTGRHRRAVHVVENSVDIAL